LSILVLSVDAVIDEELGDSEKRRLTAVEAIIGSGVIESISRTMVDACIVVLGAQVVLSCLAHNDAIPSHDVAQRTQRVFRFPTAVDIRQASMGSIELT
jgi:hypothetical protein